MYLSLSVCYLRYIVSCWIFSITLYQCLDHSFWQNRTFSLGSRKQQKHTVIKIHHRNVNKILCQEGWLQSLTSNWRLFEDLQVKHSFTAFELFHCSDDKTRRKCPAALFSPADSNVNIQIINSIDQLACFYTKGNGCHS